MKKIMDNKRLAKIEKESKRILKQLLKVAKYCNNATMSINQYVRCENEYFDEYTKQIIADIKEAFGSQAECCQQNKVTLSIPDHKHDEILIINVTLFCDM